MQTKQHCSGTLETHNMSEMREVAGEWGAEIGSTDGRADGTPFRWSRKSWFDVCRRLCAYTNNTFIFDDALTHFLFVFFLFALPHSEDWNGWRQSTNDMRDARMRLSSVGMWFFFPLFFFFAFYRGFFLLSIRIRKIAYADGRRRQANRQKPIRDGKGTSTRSQNAQSKWINEMEYDYEVS